MLYPSENNSCDDNEHHPAHDSESLLTKHECRASSGPARNNATKELRTLCYVSHGSLFGLHVALLIVYGFHTEHRVTITTATTADVVATILTVSLQSFYTVFTLALSVYTSINFHSPRSLDRIGAALSGLWDQTKIKTSMRATIAVTVYLLSISALHITSSSIIQLQTFNATTTVPVSTTVGWPDESVDFTLLDWSSITPLIPATYQVSTLSTAGISNATIYDLVSRNLGFGEAIINATTISASCGLSNSSIVQASSQDTILWKDQIRIISSGGPAVYGNASNEDPIDGTAIYIMLSTAVDLDSNLYNNIGELDLLSGDVNMTKYQTSITKIFMVGCTLLTNTRERYVNVRTNELVDAPPPPDINQQWIPWTPQDMSTLDIVVSSATAAAGPSPVVFTFASNSGPTPSNVPSVLDVYAMSLFGLNANEQAYNAGLESSSNPSFTMSRYQLENAVAQISAEAVWMAGQVGDGDGGFSRSVGETSVMQYVLQWRLNINLVPTMIATLASFIAFILAIEVTGRGRTGTPKLDESHTVKSASPLELLWLAARMPGLTVGFKDVEEPTMNNLREAGMFDVCLTDNDDATCTQQHLDRFHSVSDSFQNFNGTLRRRRNTH
ncbi:hypothetical protein BJ138DRAFT_1105846 [Hygrophoropsis aurantiaca]|uniref:Uncharacterized protein n=1 Tax=Hygrophoropsis aurantiaca TaxID=72124 RepID=A0ACB7ZWJ6_9AGAM|nr:hypothetical protein BJ138DRAFT_1105846 [Hygrophoropsis aurantiaca]